MAKQYTNTGGSGAHSSLQRYVIDWRRKAKARFNSAGLKLSEQELELYLSGTVVECLECGSHYKKLATHLRNGHSLSKDDYCEKYGIPIGTSLDSKDLRELNSKYSKERWVAGRHDTEAFKAAAKANGKSMGGVMEGHCQRCNKVIQTVKALVSKNVAVCDECKPFVTKEVAKRTYKKCLAKTVKANCCNCQKEYEVPKHFMNTYKRKGQQYYCSTKCRGEGKRKKEWRVVTCKLCQKIFETGEEGKVYCTKECYYTARRQGFYNNKKEQTNDRTTRKTSPTMGSLQIQRERS